MPITKQQAIALISKAQLAKAMRTVDVPDLAAALAGIESPDAAKLRGALRSGQPHVIGAAVLQILTDYVASQNLANAASSIDENDRIDIDLLELFT